MNDPQLEQALNHVRAGQFPEAEVLCHQILAASPEHPIALYLLALIASSTGDFTAALNLSASTIRIKPDFAEAHLIHANALYQLQQFQQAVDSYDEVLRLIPTNVEACHNRGLALHALQRYHEEIKSYDAAICLKPDFAEAWFSRGNAMQALDEHSAAIESYDKAIALNPQFAEAHYNRGVAFQALDQLARAIENYDQALQLNPDYAEACQNRGSAQLAMLNYDAALSDFDRAISIRPDFADTYNSRGFALFALGQNERALESFDKLSLIQPNYDWLPGIRLYLRGTLCDWQAFDESRIQLEAAIGRGEKVALPFTTLATSNSPSTLRQAAEIFVRDRFSASTAPAPLKPHAKHKRIRIGYFSADYHDHATSYLMAELFERHDRDRFEVIAFSFGPNSQDNFRRRVSTAMDRFFDVRTMSDHDVAQLSRTLELDIAIDLKGFTSESRPGVFASRAAPIQVNYLGYPGTMGAPFIDYLIADHTLIPPSDQQHFLEKIVYLPDTYQPNGRRAVSARPSTRAEQNLPDAAFVFCCFNNAYKITPAVFDSWMRILAQVPHSILWLLESNATAAANLRKQAARRGIARERLSFAAPLPSAKHLARLSLADLFLDTFPYTAHTTASDALWCGLPLVTRIGDTFPSRVAASLLHAIGLPKLITTTLAEYETLAIQLASDPERRHAFRQRLNDNRLTKPLFDCELFTRHLESAYLAIYERSCLGLPPDHIEVPRLRATEIKS